MIVRARDGHHLRDAHLGQHRRVRRRILGGVADGAGGDDRSLPLHQPGHRRDSPQRAGVGQGDAGALIVLRRQLVGAGATDQVAVLVHEAAEILMVHRLQVRHDQRARAIFSLHVNGDAQVHVVAQDAVRLAVDQRIGSVHLRELVERLDDGPGNQVGKRDLDPLRQQGIVDHAAVFFQHLYRHDALRGGHRQPQALLHVVHDQRRHPSNGLRFFVGCKLGIDQGCGRQHPCRRGSLGGRRGGGLGGRRGGLGGLGGRGSHPAVARGAGGLRLGCRPHIMGLEIAPPFFRHRDGAVAPLRVQLCYILGVRAELIQDCFGQAGHR